MPGAPGPRSPADVPVRRLLAASAIVFVLLLAFLAGRVGAGADPTQAAKSVSTTTPTDPGQLDPYGLSPQGSGPSYGQPSEGSAGGGAAAPDTDPPTTSAS
jgi:hypothetical protein